MMTQQPVLSEFAPSSREDWMMRVEPVLKGEDFAKRLISLTDDGIRIDPVYQQETGSRSGRVIQMPWAVVQRCDYPDTSRANAQAIDDLENGANGLAVIFQEAASAHGFGVAAPDAAALGRILKDVRLDLISLRFESGPHGRRVAEAFARWIINEPYDPERLDLSFGLDPIGALAAGGQLAAPWIEVSRHMLAVVKSLREQHFRGPFAVADGRVWHDGGASEAQELGFVLATGVAYLRALEPLDDEALARAVSITLAADQDMFLTLAKFRAVRLLWNQVLGECRLPATSLKLHAETSWRMMTRRDPYSNILRATAGVFGAALAGADSVAVLPFSMAQGLPDRFARRIARNTQTLLAEESELWRVSDPVSGSGYIEHLTHELAGKAWVLFQSVERAGGIVAALEAGSVQASVAQSRVRRVERKETIIGITDYPAPSEPPQSIEAAPPLSPQGKGNARLIIDPIPGWRIAESFESPSS
jgi:methylmalonyl-CoA mutase